MRVCTPYRATFSSGVFQNTAPPNTIFCYKYTAWCNGGHELYSLYFDPFEIVNM